MLRRIALIITCTVALSSVAQPPSSNQYRRGTITSVARHQSAPGDSEADPRYDVSVKVGNTLYTVLYTPPNGANMVEYSAGFDLLVLERSDTLTFNSPLSGKTEVPILHRETIASPRGPDVSKLPSQYFVMKQQHLSATLNLSVEQQAKIKPILEQETGEAKQFLGNPVLSRKEQLNRWEKLVSSSDEKIKPFLSESQVGKLQELRKDQKQELKKLIADQSGGQPN
ncbi:MAG TPA: hypothetical protein VJQ82_22930 [Terriglobales bacterium]|nr:hypothetical protein [Terriglobales bacterium]